MQILCPTLHLLVTWVESKSFENHYPSLICQILPPYLFLSLYIYVPLYPCNSSQSRIHFLNALELSCGQGLTLMGGVLAHD